MANAQLSRKIVFWVDTIKGTIKMGMPEEYPAPPFHEKIICGTAHEAEHWSQKMREQEALLDRMNLEEREEKEGRMKAEIRSHIHHLIANGRNSLNRDFLRTYLNKFGDQDYKWKSKRESYLHAEGYERGH
jgi:hypothetical protein